MSLRERTAWVAAITTLVIWGYYFSVFWTETLAGRLDGVWLRNLFVICMIISVVVMLGLAIVASLATRQPMDAPPDELERQITARADRIGFGLLELLLPVALIAGLLNVDAIRSAFPADPAGSTAIIFANGVLMVFILVELVREGVQIVMFRMTA